VSVQVSDLPLLVFGGNCLKTGILLNDAFNSAFSVKMNLSCWNKCGAVPFTQKPLESKDIWQEVPIGVAAAIASSSGEKEDAQIAQLLELESLNSFYCSLLTANGYDHSQLAGKAPSRSTYVAVMAPHSKERIKAIKKAKTAGQMFFATGGSHSNEFFQARKLTERDEEIKVLQQEKVARSKYCKEQFLAVKLIWDKRELNWESQKTFTKCWKKLCRGAGVLAS
jgi:hypothetical protein